MRYTILYFTILVTSSLQVLSQSHSSEIGFKFDNDALLANGSDRYYTNGIFIYYDHALSIRTKQNLQNKILGFEAGQKMFTPKSSNLISRYTIDRPFAAYLFIGSSLNLLFEDESNVRLSAEIGVVGPAAKGEEVQKFIHKTFKFHPINGWQYQVQNDLELNTSAEYNRLFVRAHLIDASINTYVNLGNGFTGIGVGPLVRLGHFNQLFNSISTHSTSIKANTKTKNTNECFLYYKPQINLIDYDATINGSLFNRHENSSEVTLNAYPFVLSQQAGFAYSTNRLAIDLAAIFDTKQVKQMARSQQWGSITFMYRYR